VVPAPESRPATRAFRPDAAIPVHALGSRLRSFIVQAGQWQFKHANKALNVSMNMGSFVPLKADIAKAKCRPTIATRFGAPFRVLEVGVFPGA